MEAKNNRIKESTPEQGKEEVMSNIREGFILSNLGRVCLVCATAAVAMSVPSIHANNKPTEVPARVIAHLTLQEAPGSEMLLQNKGDKQYLYVQKASKQGFSIVDVTKPALPSLVKTTSSANDATAGNLEMVSPDVGLAAVPDKSSKGVIHSSDNPTETVKVLDLSDPAHPKVLQTFTGVTSFLRDTGRSLIYLANNEGLWILTYPKPGLTQAKKKRPCTSEDAIRAMPAECE
jgi:hypothetical protein